MAAAQAAGQVASQGIGAYADKKRDDAAACNDAYKRGDSEGIAAAAADYNNWDEGGSNRIALHVAGGALVGGLGGGGIGSAAAGAAGAGVAAWAAGDLNRLANGTRDALGGGDTAQLAGNVAANILAGGMGALVGGGAGAFGASNADLYNRSTGNGYGKGSTANSMLGDITDWAKSTYGHPVDDVTRWAGQFAGQVVSNNGQTPPADPNPLVQANDNGKPPATGGAVVTPPAIVCAPNQGCVMMPPVATGSAAGYGPGNTTFATNGDSGDTPSIDAGKQGKHQPDHNNFIPGRSELTYPEPQKLVDDYAGSGQPANNVAPGQPGYRERVNFGKVIGDYVDPVTGEKTPTTNGIIHYSKDGVHIVPGRP